MWLKLIGSVFIVTAGAFFGFELAKRYIERPKQIRQLMNGIRSLQSYIHYAAMPLSEAFSQAARGVAAPISDLLAGTGAIMRKDAYLTPQEALTLAVKEMQYRLALHKAEVDDLILFAANLGFMNREEQQKYCDMILSQLGKYEQEALKVKEQNVTMYRYLGVCGGLMIVILIL